MSVGGKAKEEKIWDVVVIGLGGVGSFALRACAKKKSSSADAAAAAAAVLGLERFSIGHEHGSSHGATRIYRHAYWESPHYIPLILHSTQEFQSLQQQSAGQPIIEECGTLCLERTPSSSSSSSSSSTCLIDKCHKSAQEHGISTERLNSQQLEERYGHIFNFAKDEQGLLEHGSGLIRPEAAIREAIHDAVHNHGAHIQQHTRVLSHHHHHHHHDGHGEKYDTDSLLVSIVIQRDNNNDDDDKIEKKEETILARKVIVAGGAWAGDLIPSWKPFLRVTRQVQAWMDVAPNADAKLFQPSQMPAWFRVPPPPPHQSETESTATAIVLTPPIYGLPADPSSDHPSWIKVALHGRDTVVDPDANLTQTCVTPEELDELARPTIDFLKVATRRTTQIKTTMNDNNSQSPPLFVLAKPCLYTVTPDEHFLVGPPAAAASQRNVYAAARLSGHGFKMVPALGQALADLALENGTTNLPIEFLSPTRFHI